MSKFLVLLFAMIALVGCSGSDEEWEESSALAEELVESLRDADFAKVYKLHYAQSQLRTKVPEAEFVSLAKSQLKRFPTILDFTSVITPIKSQDTRAGLYQFKVESSWEGGWPLKDLPENETPLVTETMRVTVRKYGDDYEIFVARPWHDLSEEMKKSKE